MSRKSDLGLTALAGAIVTIATRPLLGGWWLDSGRGVLITTSILFGLGLIVALLPGDADARVQRAIALAFGSFIGSTVLLFAIGPGNLWPIVQGVAGLLAFVAVGAAVTLVVLLQALLGRGRPPLSRR